MMEVLFCVPSIMKKLKNKFILWVIFLIVFIISFQAYKAYSNNQRDTHSYVSVIEGNVKLNEMLLPLSERAFLQVGDIISVSSKSMALIEWGDGSLTRLWENTKITVEENTISRDYTKIQISFDLIAGKTWSNVVNLFTKDSYFKQSFQGMEAGVRGTIFDVDLNADFLNVSSHQVQLTDIGWNTILVEEGKPIRLSTLTLIEIQEFLKNIQDVAWKNLNESYDEAYFEKLKKQIETTFYQSPGILVLLDFISPKYRIIHELNTASNYDTIETLLIKIPQKKKETLYDSIFARYQKLNFVKAKDVEFYKRKIFYKKALIYLSSDTSEKQQLLQTSAYDLQNILNTQAQQWLEETLDLLLEYKDLMPQINTSFLETSFSLIPEDMLWWLQDDFEAVEALFHTNFDATQWKNINFQSIKESAEQSIQDALDASAGRLLEKISK